MAESSDLLAELPVVTLYLTERCNSRCKTCDYWRHGRKDVTVEFVAGWLPSLKALKTRVALLSGGEPLLHPEWATIATMLRDAGLKLWLVTAGLALAKHAVSVAQHFHSVTVSLDGSNRETYRAIRGLDAFEVVCAGIRAAVLAGAAVSIRVTLQRANFRELGEFVTLARTLGVTEVSFIAVDVANPHAFGRTDNFSADAALDAADLEVLEALIARLEIEHAADFAAGFIAESPRKLRGIHQYFAAVLGLCAHAPVRCNAPQLSAVISTDGHVRPCFFIPGPSGAMVGEDLGQALNGPAMRALRATIRAGERAECTACVCSLWCDPARLAGETFLLTPRAA